MSDRFDRCKEHQVRNCLVCHPITRAAKVQNTATQTAAVAQVNAALPDVPVFPSGSEAETCPKCGSAETKPEGDHPAGNWWSVCAGCGLAVSKWDSSLKQELAKVPEGTRYIDAPNYPKIKELLDEATPLRPVYTATSYEGQVTAASARFTAACKNFMTAQTKVAQLREDLDKAKNAEELAHVERVESQKALQELISKGAE